MLLKLVSIQLRCYNSLVLNAIPMTTTKKIFIEYSRKEVRGELKLFTKKNQTQKRTVIKEMKGTKAYRKEIAKWQK